MMEKSAGDRATREVESTHWIYCNLCHGVPPIGIESPLFFFGVQYLAALASLVALPVIALCR